MNPQIFSQSYFFSVSQTSYKNDNIFTLLEDFLNHLDRDLIIYGEKNIIYMT